MSHALLGCMTQSPREIVSNAESEVDKKTRFMHQRKLTALEREKKSLQNQKEENQSMVPSLDGTEKKRKVKQGAMINITIVAFMYSILRKKWCSQYSCVHYNTLANILRCA